MKMPRRSVLFKIQLIGMISIFLQSCGLGVTPSTTTCPANTVVIYIYDTQVAQICGCNEGRATYNIGSSAFKCTAPIGTYFSFTFMNPSQTHNLSVSGSPPPFGTATTFTSVGNGETTQEARASSTTTAGSFFDDVSSVSGTIIITN